MDYQSLHNKTVVELRKLAGERKAPGIAVLPRQGGQGFHAEFIMLLMIHGENRILHAPVNRTPGVFHHRIESVVAAEIHAYGKAV